MWSFDAYSSTFLHKEHNLYRCYGSIFHPQIANHYNYVCKIPYSDFISVLDLILFFFLFFIWVLMNVTLVLYSYILYLKVISMGASRFFNVCTDILWFGIDNRLPSRVCIALLLDIWIKIESLFTAQCKFTRIILLIHLMLHTTLEYHFM